MSETLDKINDYLQSGGLFNPECMEHQQVRDLLMECRTELAEAQARIVELEKELRDTCGRLSGPRSLNENAYDDHF